MKVHVRSNGFGFEAFDAQTGEGIEGVQAVEISVDREGFATAKLTIALPSVDIRPAITDAEATARFDEEGAALRQSLREQQAAQQADGPRYHFSTGKLPCSPEPNP